MASSRAPVVPPRPAAVALPYRNSTILRTLGTVALRATGWRIAGALPSEPRFVAVVAPHTSNWDFPVGVAAMFALDLRISWFGKHTLFRWPAGALLRRLGGRPVRRDTPEGMVTEMAAMMRAEPSFIFALAPEGTRKAVTRWRTGFYRIAEAAGVPIVPVWLDWSRHEIGIGAPLCPSGDLEVDVAQLRASYRREMARRAEGFWPEDTGPLLAPAPAHASDHR